MRMSRVFISVNILSLVDLLFFNSLTAGFRSSLFHLRVLSPCSTPSLSIAVSLHNYRDGLPPTHAELDRAKSLEDLPSDRL